MNNNMTSITVLVVYLSVLMIVGFYMGRKVKSGADYAIGGRNIPGWVAALSERATDCSAWILLGLPGTAYAMGVSSIWTAVGCLVGSAGAWWLVAGRLRNEADKYNAVTYIDWVSKRHSNCEKGVRIFGSMTIAFFFIVYVGAQLIGGGKTFLSLFGLDPRFGILITACIIIPYTLYGGFGSVVYTDCIQSLLMFSALVLGPIFGFIYICNEPSVYASSISEAFHNAGPQYLDWFGAAKGFGKGVVIGNGLSWCIAYIGGGLPQLTTRFMSIKDDKGYRSGRVVSVTYIVLSYVGAIAMGFIGLAMFGPSGLTDVEQVMPMVMMKVFPRALATLFITGGIAAMISTADSLLALASAEVAEDIIKPYFMKGKELTKKQSLKISRVVTISVAILAIIIASIFPQKVVFQLVSYVWAGLGSPFSVVTLCTLFWKKYTGKAAVWTIIVGLFFTIFWIVSGLDARVITSMFAGFAAALITAVVVTYMTQPSKEEVKAKV